MGTLEAESVERASLQIISEMRWFLVLVAIFIVATALVLLCLLHGSAPPPPAGLQPGGGLRVGDSGINAAGTPRAASCWVAFANQPLGSAAVQLPKPSARRGSCRQ